MEERLLSFTIRLDQREQEMAKKLSKYHKMDSVGRLFAQYIMTDLAQIQIDRQKAAELATINNKPIEGKESHEQNK